MLPFAPNIANGAARLLLCPTDATFSLLTPLMYHVGLVHTQDSGFHKMDISSVKVNSTPRRLEGLAVTIASFSHRKVLEMERVLLWPL